MANEYELTDQMREISRNIPDEMLLFEEILVRLPVKSLTIYKSVCKPWLHRIESCSFGEIHRRRHIRYFSDQILFSPLKSIPDPITKSSSLLPSTHSFGPSLIKMMSKPLDAMLPPEMTRLNWPDDVELDEPAVAAGITVTDWRASVIVLGPVRTTGIYCIVAYLLRDPLLCWARHPLPNAKISICNPATRDYKLANPFPPEETARLLDLTARQHCSVRYGFGLAADGDYKVVVVVTWFPTFKSFLSYVYSLKQGTWKKIVDSENDMVSRLDLRGKQYFPLVVDVCELCPQVFLNSCWHWMAMFWDGSCSVLCFDVDNEKFKLMHGPPSYRGRMINDGDISSRVTKSRVTVLNNHLAALYNTSNQPCDRRGVISIWMMMEYGDEESWINIWKVNLESSPMKTLVGISYSLREDDNGNCGVHINRIVFEDCIEQLVYCDEFGAVKEQPGFDTSSCVFWNNIGISAYSETLERV